MKVTIINLKVTNDGGEVLVDDRDKVVYGSLSAYEGELHRRYGYTAKIEVEVVR